MCSSKQADVLSKILTGLSISNRSSPGVLAILFQGRGHIHADVYSFSFETIAAWLRIFFFFFFFFFLLLLLLLLLLKLLLLLLLLFILFFQIIL